MSLWPCTIVRKLEWNESLQFILISTDYANELSYLCHYFCNKQRYQFIPVWFTHSTARKYCVQNTSIPNIWLHLAILIWKKNSHFDHVIPLLAKSTWSIYKLGTILDFSLLKEKTAKIWAILIEFLIFYEFWRIYFIQFCVWTLAISDLSGRSAETKGR